MAREERAHELFRFMTLRGPESTCGIDLQQDAPAIARSIPVMAPIERAIKEGRRGAELEESILTALRERQQAGHALSESEVEATALFRLSKKTADVKQLIDRLHALVGRHVTVQDFVASDQYRAELGGLYESWLLARAGVTERSQAKAAREYVANIEACLRTAKALAYLAQLGGRLPSGGARAVESGEVLSHPASLTAAVRRIMAAPVLLPKEIRRAITSSRIAHEAPRLKTPPSETESEPGVPISIEPPRSAGVSSASPVSLSQAQERWNVSRKQLDDLMDLRERIVEAAADVSARRVLGQPSYNPPVPPAKGAIGRWWERTLGRGTRTTYTRAQDAAAVDSRFTQNETRDLLATIERAAPDKLASYGITPAVFDSVATIPLVLTKLEDEVCALAGKANASLTLLGPTRLMLGTRVTQRALDEAFRPTVQARALMAPPTAAVQVLGFADLVVVRQRLLRYELGEIAHIENVLPGETRDRTHTRTRSLEEITEVEREEEQEEERDLQSTERFEMQAETQTTLQENFKIDFGLNVSASYGTAATGSINVNSNLGIGYSTSKTESERQASDFAKEVVSKAASKVRNRVRTARRTTAIERTEERNQHGLTGDPVNPFSGVYHWVDKVYEVELREYGNRFMLEFFVPEPAAYQLKLDYESPNSELLEPAEFNVTAAEIGPENYLALAHQYQAFDVEPPPPVYVNVGFAHRSDATNLNNAIWDNYSYIAHDQEIPSGYVPEAVALTATGGNYHWSNSRLVKDMPWLNVAVCGATIFDDWFTSGASHYIKLDHVVSAPYLHEAHKTIPLTVRVSHVEDQVTTVNLVIICKRTCRGYREWQIKTHDAIMRQYIRLRTDYEDRVANQGASSGVSIDGRNPLENREREKEELKKAAIQLLRRQSFAFDAIDETGVHPLVNEAAADQDRQVVQFFESAFEWNQMTYFFLPYFWGNPDKWNLRCQLHSNDPIHRNFLRAGAAKVLVPVSPGFERMIMNYIDPPADLGPGPIPETQRLWLDRDPSDLSPPTALFPEVWMELLQVHMPDLIKGSGLVSVKRNDPVVDVVSSNWTVRQRDADGAREIFVEGVRYTISAVLSDTQFRLDRPYEGSTRTDARYMLGSVLIGSPWEERVPTSLVILGGEKAKLTALYN